MEITTKTLDRVIEEFNARHEAAKAAEIDPCKECEELGELLYKSGGFNAEFDQWSENILESVITGEEAYTVALFMFAKFCFLVGMHSQEQTSLKGGNFVTTQ